jgi:hypothetical protein
LWQQITMGLLSIIVGSLFFIYVGNKAVYRTRVAQTILITLATSMILQFGFGLS